MATFQKIISENSGGQVSISNRVGIGLSSAPSAPLHVSNGTNGHSVIRLEDLRSGDNTITAGGRLDFYSNHLGYSKVLGQIFYEQQATHHQNVRFQIKGTLAGVGGKLLVKNDDNGKWSFYNNYTEDLALVIKNQKLGIGNVTNPGKPLTVNHDSDVWKVAIQHDSVDRMLLGTGTSTQTISTANASDNLDFSLGGSTKMRLEGTTGDFGVGTSSPRGRLDVLGTSSSQGFYVSNYGGAVYLPTDYTLSLHDALPIDRKSVV